MHYSKLEEKLLGHYWLAQMPDGGQVVIYFYQIKAREGGVIRQSRMAIWTELIRGRITYRTEPAPFALQSVSQNEDLMLTFEGINQGTLTFLEDSFILDQLQSTLEFYILTDSEIRELYQPILL
ncbi:MAG TPA: hypothetical protein DCE41_36940 [Cytophagales bacterium]|nr:hypothetical protein [Cytophagales bacterium]HAA21157.1 hypothetical protein [Cytophagales bacterium]HAP60678.1 hypothetical protein [Cytophagales bacterium]